MRLMRFFTTPMLVVLAVVLVGVCRAGEGFEIEDSRGDDFGAGGIVYPDRDDYAPGDLDLVVFKAEMAAEGVWFSASFANPIRSPRGRVIGVGPEPLDRYARLGFYTFNIDMYIDQDGVAGSGNRATIPGRQVEVDRRYAWEKAVILTPRPNEARILLQNHLENVLEQQQRADKGRLAEEDLKAIRASVADRLNNAFFFPDDIRVRSRTIRYFVPASFLGESMSEAWRYVVFVTGADVEQQMRIAGLRGRDFSLMMMPVAVGRPRDSFGLRNDTDIGQPPVIDLLTPSLKVQQLSLSDYNTAARRLATLPAVAPGGLPGAMSSSKNESVTEQPAAIADTKQQASDVDEMLNATVAKPPTSPAGHGTAERLRTLNQLKAEGLISDKEFEQLRHKILSDI